MKYSCLTLKTRHERQDLKLRNQIVDRHQTDDRHVCVCADSRGAFPPKTKAHIRVPESMLLFEKFEKYKCTLKQVKSK